MSRHVQNFLAAPLAVLLLLTVEPAFAAGRQGQEKAARKACLAGDYAKGVSILADLFVETKDSTYIFNQGRCLEQNGKHEDAIARFQEYLGLGGAALRQEDREAAEKHIATCRENLAQSRGIPSGAAAPLPPTPPTPLPPPNPAPTPASGPSNPIVIQPQPQPQPSPSAGQDRAGLRVAGIVTASVGIAAFLAAVALNVKANSMASEIQSTANGYVKENDRKTYETFSWVGYGLGTACVATGAVLFGIGLRSGGSASASVALMPAIAPDHAGVLMTGGF